MSMTSARTMTRDAMNVGRLATALALVIGLSGCGGFEPIDYVAGSEIPARPGLLTGEAGAFVLRPSLGRSRPDAKPAADEADAKDAAPSGTRR